MKIMTNHRDLGAVSNCCGKLLYDNSELCPDCWENCVPEIECDKCSGQGVTKFLVVFTQICTKCNGEGSVYLNDGI